MNSKAIKRQLLAAIAMVLVAAIALGSSTYAWFVQAGSVTAEGMSVNVQSDGGLVIRYGENGGWGITASAGMTTTKLNPASTFNMAEWSYAKAQYSTAPDALDKDRQDITNIVYTDPDKKTFNTGDTNIYVVMKDFYIRSSNPSLLAKGLYVEDIVVKATQLTSTALRVGMIVNGDYENPFIFGPVEVTGSDGKANSASTEYTFHRGATPYNTENVELDTKGQGTAIVAQGTTIEGAGKTPVHVQIFIWFEGEDHNLYTDILHSEKLDITVKFSSFSYEAPATTPAQGESGQTT